MAAGADPWHERAARFDAACGAAAAVEVEALSEGLCREDHVADLGAGTGRHALAIAQRCAVLTAIEPSAAMRARLQARIASEGAQITVVAEAWPCALAPVDVAYSAHVLYGVHDAVSFLESMTRAARRSCRLLLGLRPPSEKLAPLARELHGGSLGPRPAALEVLCLLHQLGHRAFLRVLDGGDRASTVAPTDAALDELSARLRLGRDDATRARVRATLDRLYPRSSTADPWNLGISSAQALIEWPGRGH